MCSENPFSLLHFPPTAYNILLRVDVARVPDGSGKPPDGTTVNITVATEIKFMKRLTERNCSSTPRMLEYALMRQPEGMCLPGGYIVFILMELLPGKMIMDFWSYSREKRSRIREAAKKALLWVSIT